MRRDAICGETRFVTSRRCIMCSSCEKLTSISVGERCREFERNSTVGRVVRQYDNPQGKSARSMGIVQYRSVDSQPQLDHSLFLLTSPPLHPSLLFSFSFLLFYCFGLHIVATSVTFQTMFSFSSLSQEIFTDNSMPPLHLLSQSQNLDTHHCKMPLAIEPTDTCS